MPDEKELEFLRSQIDEVDATLVELLNRRVALAARVGEIKRESGESLVYRPEREAQILSHVRQLSSGAISDESLLLLFREIISACRGAESRTRVAVLGPEGTYTQAAALKHFGHQVDIHCALSIEEVFRVVTGGDADYGTVPVENTIEGGVSNTLDALFESDLTICGEINLPIRHCLLSKAESPQAVKEVLAHVQALGQCRRWLAANLPAASQRSVASNAEAARLAARDDTLAAIAGEAVAELYDLRVLERGIQDMSENTTRFLVIGRRDVPPSGRDKTSIVLSARNRPGALFDLLQPMARHGIDLTRIESRPARRGRFEYLFFVDMAGHRADGLLATALAELRDNAALFRVLGSYPMAVD